MVRMRNWRNETKASEETNLTTLGVRTMEQSAIRTSMHSPLISHLGTADTNRYIAHRAMELVCSQRNSFHHSIRCEFHEGALLIHGHVSTYFEKQLVQESVRSIPGIQLIVNHVEVVPHAVPPNGTKPEKDDRTLLGQNTPLLSVESTSRLGCGIPEESPPSSESTACNMSQDSCPLKGALVVESSVSNHPGG